MEKFIKTLLFVLLAIKVEIFPQGETTIRLGLDYKIEQLPFGLSHRVPVLKPIVAIALSGGGARGISQIGVIKALEENNVPINMIVGTSMGSIVGGLYSSGYTVNELDSITKFTDWDNLLSLDSKTNRRELFVEQKVTEDKAVFSLRLKGLKPIIPTSINDGQKLSNYLNLLTLQAPVKVKENFSSLEHNFFAVCTNLETGRPVILNYGSLSQALRASSSVSFLLSPVLIDSLILVDGGLVANIPVVPAKELGADFVIAVNTTSPLRTKDELELPWIVADQVVSIPMKLQNEYQNSFADFVIAPDLNNNSSTDFSNLDSLIKAGYESAKNIAGRVKSRIDSIFYSSLTKEEKFFHNVKIVESDFVDKTIIDSYQNLDSVSSAKILFDISNIESSGNYEEVFAEITEKPEATFLKFIVNENPKVNEVIVDGTTSLSKEFVDSVFNPLLNNVFNPHKVINAVKEVLRIYRQIGYSLAELDTTIFDKQTGRLFFLFKEGRISDIIVRGNDVTNSTVIKREFPIKPGDIFLNKKIQEGLTNLRSTNLFESVTISVEKRKNDNYLIVDVDEKISSLIRFGFKFDNENRPQISIDLRDENIFGTGAEIGLVVFLSQRGRSYVAEQKSMRLFDTYLTYSLNGYYKLNDVFTYKDDISQSNKRFSRSLSGEYRQIFYGFSASLGTQVQRFGNLIFTGKYEMNEVKNLSQSPLDPFLSCITSFKGAFIIDTQDKYPYPSKGLRLSGFYETAQKILGGEIGYTNFGADYKGYLSFSESHTISTTIKIGFGDKTLPITQQYSLGGQYSFFGMRENEYKGRQIFLTSLEYRYMFPFKIFFDTYILFRYDLGSIWAEQETIKFKELRHGLGGTLSFNTPIGPAEFSVGRSFNLIQNLPGNPLCWGPVYFYFSVGFYY